MKKILITGSTAYDLLLQSDGSFAETLRGASLDHLSVAFLAPHFRKHHGGTGANIAWNVKLLGAVPLLVSTVGNDGAPYMALLRERGIATDRVDVLAPHSTATAIVATDSGERQITFFHPGADAFGTWPDLQDEREDIAWAIVSPRAATVMLRAMTWCREQKIPVLFDPGQQMQAFSDDDLDRAVRGASGVIVNDFEAQLLARRLRTTEQELALQIPLFVVTRGEEGCSFYEQGKRMDVPACAAETVVNPTGAGDAFRAGLLTGLVQQWSLLRSCRLGAALGSFVVEIEGTLLEDIDREAVIARMKETYGEA